MTCTKKFLYLVFFWNKLEIITSILVLDFICVVSEPNSQAQWKERIAVFITVLFPDIFQSGFMAVV